MARIHISNYPSGRIIVSFPYEKTTEIHTHVSNKDFVRIRNPLDQILQNYTLIYHSNF